jgi:putative PEP-CTERM system histidine kinase
VAWLGLATLLWIRRQGNPQGRWLLVAAALQVGWAVSAAVDPAEAGVSTVLSATFEALRPLGWSIFLIVLLDGHASRTASWAGVLACTAIAAAHAGALLAGATLSPGFVFGLLAAVFVLLCVEQVYRNTAEDARWSIKFLCLALASIAAYDIVLYTDALLYERIDGTWWAARGFANAAIVPLVAIAAARTKAWKAGIRVSRNIVFHSATLVSSGLFLLAVSAIGYGLRLFGGAWAGVAQMLVAFIALVALIALIASANLRARLRVLISKHFFTYRYDYRAEWLRLTTLLAAPDRGEDPESSLTARSLDGLRSLVESPGGALWLRTDQGTFVCEAQVRSRERVRVDDDDPMIRYLEARGWIVDVPEWRAHPERYEELGMPIWLASDPDTWLVVPLSLQGRLTGFVTLQHSVAHIGLDWEVRDILKAAGTQIAGYLAVRQAVEKLVQARQFDSFNRMSAFVVHDLKNLVAQMTLLLNNAQRHRDNPVFQQDVLETVENVVDRMRGLLMQLRVGTRPIETAAPILIAETLRTALAAKKGLRLTPRLDTSADLESVEVVAHRDRLERVVGHLVQNAVEATEPGGEVRVRGRRDGDTAIVEVVDTGRGMSPDFIERRLFRPFTSTKALGMGIGAYESREYIREIGGAIDVASTEGFGTTFTIRLPVVVASVGDAGSR